MDQHTGNAAFWERNHDVFFSLLLFSLSLFSCVVGLMFFLSICAYILYTVTLDGMVLYCMVYSVKCMTILSLSSGFSGPIPCTGISSGLKNRHGHWSWRCSRVEDRVLHTHRTMPYLHYPVTTVDGMAWIVYSAFRKTLMFFHVEVPWPPTFQLSTTQH